MMKKISYIYAIIILILFLFVPGFLNAATYYDWERVQVDTLPEANKENMNTVYIKDGKYYVVKENSGEVTPIPLSTNLNTYTLYKAFPDDITDILEYQALLKYTDEYTSYFDLKGIFLINFNLSSNSFNLHFYCKTNTNCYTYTLGNNFSFEYSYDYISPTELEVTRYGSSRSFPDEFKDFILYLYNHISITPLENTFEWLEVDKYQVKEIKLDERDFYLFYNFEDIKEFNILSNYDLESFTDFQKVVIVLGFNILFLGIIGLSIYIFIKLVYKGISMIFKF